MNIFNQVQFSKPSKNKFDLSHERKMSLKMGTLTPFFLQEVIPGDKFRVNTEMLLRMQPMLAPIFHRVRVKTDFFFVPNRLVWDEWQKFITGGEQADEVQPVAPYLSIIQASIDLGVMGKGSLSDYFGLPTIEASTPTTSPIQISALPFRAYQLIFNEYFRDQNLQDPIVISKGSGVEANTYDMMLMRKRAWEKDYFTSCLPFAQKSGEPVSIPGSPDYKNPSMSLEASTGLPSGTADTLSHKATGEIHSTADATDEQIIDNLDGVSINVNDLRISVRLQQWLEKNARAGSRYIESILAHFGVLSSDARLQRPEYLGGNVNPVVISEVVSTFQFSGDAEGQPQGHMAGHGISSGGYGGFKRRFEEHGYIIGLMTVIPRTAYQQGIPKHFTRFDKLEYAWPIFSQLGEQEVKNSELYFDLSNAVYNNATFGYQSRYAEYKYQPSTVHGDFRDNLAYWHMGRIFSAPPALNEAFITADPTKRIFAVELQTEDEVLCQLYNKVDAIRPLPYFNNPSL